MTWTGQIFAVGQILTAAQMNNLQGDITALANGDSGAPSIVQAALGANSVGQGQIKDALQQSSGSINANILFTGGVFTLGWGLAASGIQDVVNYSSAGYASGIGITGTGTYYLQARYFQASPPYDLGYGEIPLFIFATIDNTTGEVVAVDTAPEAPWHYNGPTDIKAKVYRGGKSYRFAKPVEIEMLSLDTNALTDEERAAIVRRIKNEESTELFEITQDVKNADIDIVPNPFIGNDLTGKTVVLLDPCSSLCEELSIFRELGEDVNSMLMNGHLTIDNTPLNVKSPRGVQTVKFKRRLKR